MFRIDRLAPSASERVDEQVISTDVVVGMRKVERVLLDPQSGSNEQVRVASTPAH
jgi:hypothetical protein